MTDEPSSPPPARRGVRVRELCDQEGISRRTAWRWVGKGVLTVSRLGPRTGVRVRHAEPQAASDDDDFE